MLRPVKTAVETAQLVRSGALSAGEVIGEALARAETARRELNALLAVPRERALAAAAELDARIAAGEDPGPLAGVPVVVKDNICTRGVPTTAGSRSLAEFVPPYNATVVERLEAAGAVVIAKANLDEFAMGGSNEHSAFGPVRNPHDPERVPGGSSGGSAAAVAAGVAPLALGTDTGGSVRQPASFCGVIGFKPTYGVLSRYGSIAFASSLDHVGVFGRAAEDVAVALRAMAGRDPLDSTSLAAPPGLGPDGAPGTGPGRDGPWRAGDGSGPAEVTPSGGRDGLAGRRMGVGLAGRRVGIVREFAGPDNSPGVREALERTRTALERLGAEVVEVSVPHARQAIPAYLLLAAAEASSNLARYDGMTQGARVGAEALGQEQVMRLTRGAGLGREVRRRVLLGTLALSSGRRESYYDRAVSMRRLVSEELDEALAGCDLLLTPTVPGVAFRLGERLGTPTRLYQSDSATCLANLAGIPAVSVPAGPAEDGLPCGMQLIGPHLSDALLLQAAAELGNLALG